ncbi:MAG TPA: UvrD-helicase domain-containing protein [Acidimicrobiia bacterium]|nr:UvrD-helicase domain-containing protein [Acidimicrobiia bacterium]
MAWDEDLSTEQQEAAGVASGHLVLLAGPGTGKTFVLVRRIQYLIEVVGVSPGDIQALTFSRAAAAEMRDRLVEQLGDRGERVRVSTLHSSALRQLMLHGARRLPAPVRVAGDWEERWIVIEELARLLGRRVKEISNGKDGALDLLADDWETLEADGAGWEAGHPDAQFLSAWQRHRQVYGYTLRSELVYQLLIELRSDPALSPEALREIVVDEYQPRLEGRVTFTTMHGAKGLTADTVIVLQAEDEVIPGDGTGAYLDEARRLLYVSLTRARKKLVIGACRRRIGPQRFVGEQEIEKRQLTRFLADYGLMAQTIEQYLADD